MPKRTKEDFINEAVAIHGEKYDYSNVVYSRAIDKVEIICPIHGSFWQAARKHLKGQGCPDCGNDSVSKKKTLDTESFLCKARKIHGDRYDYSRVEYVTANTKVEILCPEHGSFWQVPNSHLSGRGCPECGANSSVSTRSKGLNATIDDFYNVHGDRYDYSKVEYTGQNDKVEIICPVHGSFWQTPAAHTSGQGCSRCGQVSAKKKVAVTTSDFIAKANRLHNYAYDYSKANYISSKANIEIICPVHGSFWQSAGNHSTQTGCPRCSALLPSSQEVELYEFITGIIGVDSVEANTRSVIPPYELDIYIPEHGLAIEFDGLHWHSTAVQSDKEYHLNKTKRCEDNGIRLIHVYEDEWQDKKDRIKSMIGHAIGKNTATSINARSCHIAHVETDDSRRFCEAHHIQGFMGSSVKLGLFYENELVAYIGLTRYKNGVYDLVRYCTSHNVRGGFSKLLNYFKKNYDWTYIYTYAERRYSQGHLYRKNGFTLEYTTSPGYDYVKSGKRFSRQHFMKHKLKARLEKFDADLTEEENMRNNGYYRIYDCGVYRFSITR